MEKRNTFKTYFKRIDVFATDISFRENGAESFGSIFGALISLIIVLVCLIHGINKSLCMKNYSDTIFNEFSVKFGLTPDEIA